MCATRHGLRRPSSPLKAGGGRRRRTARLNRYARGQAAEVPALHKLVRALRAKGRENFHLVILQVRPRRASGARALVNQL